MLLRDLKFAWRLIVRRPALTAIAVLILGLGIGAKGVGTEMSDARVDAELARAFPFDDLDVGEGARGGAGPVTLAGLDMDEQEIQAELEEDMDGDEEFKAILASGDAGSDLADLDRLAPSPEDRQRGTLTVAKAAATVARVAVRVLRRFVGKHDHGFYPTVVEEILRELYLADTGAWVWRGMKTAADCLIQKTCGNKRINSTGYAN